MAKPGRKATKQRDSNQSQSITIAETLDKGDSFFSNAYKRFDIIAGNDYMIYLALIQKWDADLRKRKGFSEEEADMLRVIHETGDAIRKNMAIGHKLGYVKQEGTGEAEGILEMTRQKVAELQAQIELSEVPNGE